MRALWFMTRTLIGIFAFCRRYYSALRPPAGARRETGEVIRTRFCTSAEQHATATPGENNVPPSYHHLLVSCLDIAPT